MLTIETKELEISENLKKCDDIYVNGYDKKIKFKDLENYIKLN